MMEVLDTHYPREDNSGVGVGVMTREKIYGLQTSTFYTNRCTFNK